MDNLTESGNPTNLELLRLAKELAYADYNNRRANIHNQWVVDNDRMQRTHKVNVPYPSIPQYPTEDEIISRAKKLIDFLNHPRPDLEKQTLHNEVKQLITDVEKELGKTTVVEEQTEPTQQPITETGEKQSVLGKIKNVWR